MNEELLDKLYPIQELVDDTIQALEEAESIRKLAIELQKSGNEQLLEINKLKKQNHSLQMFIEDHATDEQKKLIFRY